MPKPTTLNFNDTLTDFAVTYANAEMIQDMIMPPRRVEQKSYTYYEEDQAEKYVLPDDLVSEDGVPKEIDVRFTKKTGLCLDYSYGAFVNNDDIDQAKTPIEIQKFKTQSLVEKCMLKKEMRVAAAIYNASNYATANKVDIAGAWPTIGTTIIDQLVTGLRACWKPPTHLVMDILSWDAVCKNTQVLSVIKGTLAPQDFNDGGKANPAAVQNQLGLFLGVQVVIGKARNLSVKKGQTPAYGYVWNGTNAGKGGAAFVRIGGDSPWDLHSIRQFQWKGRQVLTGPSGRGARGGQEIRCVDTYDIKSISTTAGYLFQDTLVT